MNPVLQADNIRFHSFVSFGENILLFGGFSDSEYLDLAAQFDGEWSKIGKLVQVRFLLGLNSGDLLSLFLYISTILIWDFHEIFEEFLGT